MLVSANGRRVVTCDVVLPLEGAWSADLTVDTDAPLVGTVTLTIAGGMTLVGTAARSGAFEGRISARVVGGKAGLSKTIPAKFYRDIDARTVALDALTEAGESLSSAASPALATTLPKWTRIEGRASGTLAALARHLGGVWRVEPGGAVWLGVDTFPAVTLTHAVTRSSPSEDWVEIATDSFTLLPAVTFRDRRVAQVEMSFSAKRSRVHVLYG